MLSPLRGWTKTRQLELRINLSDHHEEHEGFNPSCLLCSSWFKNKTASSYFTHFPNHYTTSIRTGIQKHIPEQALLLFIV